MEENNNENNNEEKQNEEKNENGETKECPFCGKQININAKKCKYCKNWIDEEIQCPYCFEKIKASAKKCRYCGEWLDKDKKETKSEAKNNFKLKYKHIIIAICAFAAIVAAVVVITMSYSFIPDCNNTIIKNKLREYLKTQYPITDAGINSITQNSKNEKGYTCTAHITGNDNDKVMEFNVKYTYEKAGLNTYNFTSEIVLPDCYSTMIQSLVEDLIRKTKKFDFIDNVQDMAFEYASIEKYDEKNKNYSCTADVVMKAKPGKAISLYWYDDTARKTARCKVYYGSQFCQNSITSCAQLFDISSCKYDED